MVCSRHPIRSALWLVLSLAATAVCYLLLGAPFAAGAQAVVYAGGVVVLIVFAVMLLRLKGDALDRRAGPEAAVALAIGAGLLATVLPAFRGMSAGAAAVPAGFGSALEAGEGLLGAFLFPFELISLLLLCAMVAAVVLGRKGDSR